MYRLVDIESYNRAIEEKSDKIRSLQQRVRLLEEQLRKTREVHSQDFRLLIKYASKEQVYG
jgi:hypothetical protein